MFILVFVVSFGPKKGTIIVYSDSWYLGFYQTFMTYPTYLKKILTSTDWSNFGVISVRTLNHFLLARFQFTLLTSRSTIYLLFFFWCFFFFFGEILLLTTFNFNTLNDLIPSSFFLLFKTHTVFLMDNSNDYLNQIIFFYITFFTLSSFLFLLNLRYTSNYKYFLNLLTFDYIFWAVILYVFSWQLLLISSLFYFWLRVR
jgi:hypothetical protein